jgi:hypothetical protein
MRIYNILITILLLFITQILYSQAIKFGYGYDLSGNRITREIIDMTPIEKSTIKDTVFQDDQIIEDLLSHNQIENDGFYSGDRVDIDNFDNIDTEHLKIKYENFNINLFPNPVKEILYIELSGGYIPKNISCMLIDINGRIVEEKKLESESESFDFAKHPSGIYMMRVLVDSSYKEYKIIKN